MQGLCRTSALKGGVSTTAAAVRQLRCQKGGESEVNHAGSKSLLSAALLLLPPSLRTC